MNIHDFVQAHYDFQTVRSSILRVASTDQQSKPMTADELLTKKDLADFKKELLDILAPLLGGKLPSQQKWLKNKDVRALLGVSSNTIVSLRESGKLPYHQVNSTYLYKQSDIDEMMNGLEKKSPKTKKG